MDKLKIKQSIGLKGTVCISGAKNAALPIICASLLSNDGLTLDNIPDLKDIRTLTQLLSGMGARCVITNNQLSINTANISNYDAPYDLVKTMRASILVLGPLLARFGQASVSLPGGCAIGTRPVDQHIKGLEQMGAHITIENGYITAHAHKLKGTRIIMDLVTVTGTENLLMAATLASGTTTLQNCAREPEVTDLANCLVKMGAQIEGIGSDTLVIHGVKNLYSTTHTVIPDRIETGTYAIASVITQSDLVLSNCNTDIMGSTIDKLKQTGAKIDYDSTHLHVSMHKRPKAVDIKTLPYPAFPTDMQAQFMVLNCISSGVGTITETIFENRYMHVPELCRMGADISIDGNIAIVKGVNALTGAKVMATDLRASASLVLAAMVAKGETIIDRVYHLDRGYDKMEHKLNNVGANIVRI